MREMATGSRHSVGEDGTAALAALARSNTVCCRLYLIKRAKKNRVNKSVFGKPSGSKQSLKQADFSTRTRIRSKQKRWCWKGSCAFTRLTPSSCTGWAMYSIYRLNCRMRNATALKALLIWLAENRKRGGQLVPKHRATHLHLEPAGASVKQSYFKCVFSSAPACSSDDRTAGT